MYCENCGNKMEATERFCGVCGWDSQSGGGEQQSDGNFGGMPYTPPAPPVPPEPQKKKVNVLLIVVIIFAVAAVGVGGYFIYDRFFGGGADDAVIDTVDNDRTTDASDTTTKAYESESETTAYNRYSKEETTANARDGERSLTYTVSGGYVAAVSDEDGLVSSDCRERLLNIATRLAQQGKIDCGICVSSGYDAPPSMSELSSSEYIMIEIMTDGYAEIYRAGYGVLAFDNDTSTAACEEGANSAKYGGTVDERVYDSASSIAAILSSPLSDAASEIRPFYDGGSAFYDTMYVFDVGSAGLFVRSSPEQLGGKKDAVNNIVRYSSSGKPVYLEDDEEPFVFFTCGDWAYLEISKHGETIRGWSSLEYLTSVKPTSKDSGNAQIISLKTNEGSGNVLNVRSGPGYDYDVVDTVYNKTKVVVSERNNGWAKVSYDGKTGWCDMSVAGLN